MSRAFLLHDASIEKRMQAVIFHWLNFAKIKKIV
jgi:hypothetical protein